MSLNSPHHHNLSSLERDNGWEAKHEGMQELDVPWPVIVLTMLFTFTILGFPHHQRHHGQAFHKIQTFSTFPLPTLLELPSTPLFLRYPFLSTVRHLVPPARFEASKLKVVLMGEEMNEYSGVIPRTYILSHCDFTANLTLTISNVINLDQLRGWYSKDDVVAEWKKIEGQLGLHIHCYVSGPNLMLDLAAELRYHIFSKEMALVLEAVLHGDSVLLREHPELMEALVWVYFHSSSPKYNRLECWGPLKDAAKGRQGDHFQAFITASKDGSSPAKKWRGQNPFSKLFLPFFFEVVCIEVITLMADFHGQRERKAGRT
ncbi:hypothetical protein GH714_000763 [Hevea brasiliensis]|uniref:Staygreen protein domain-containing protein n=1 Tax=Hevea brasiliensis TaxID=3981 RepID=A0A6A6L7R9_HEVBR|nr:hypothetical protein GH714_000763 [Hevea brasiliensis]